MELLKVANIYKKYNAKADFAISDISLVGNSGEIVGLLGHNGAGKSTTIKCITGMHPYEQGEIFVGGHDLKKEPIDAKSSFGYVSDEFALFEKMTGYEYVNFMADIYGVSNEERKARIENFENMFRLGSSLYNQISSYSHGMKQKVSLMGALIHNPKVFILDEPMVGLDPLTASKLKEFFVSHSKAGNLVLFSSHNLDVVEKLCHRVYIIDRGVILEEIDLKKFKKQNKNLEEYFLKITSKGTK